MKIVPLVRLFTAALFCVLFVGCKTCDIDEYELKRARLYDAALTLCVEAQETSFWNSVDDGTKKIIETYRVPSLEVVLRAVWQMDHDPRTCLAEAYSQDASLDNEMYPEIVQDDMQVAHYAVNDVDCK